LGGSGLAFVSVVLSRSWRVLLAIAGLTAGCSSGGSAELPTLLSPFQNQATGSVWSLGTAGNALRPQFRWTAVEGASTYRIQVDGTCVTGTVCTFSNPAIDKTVTTTSFTPESDLAVETAPPVGRRYFWRVGACGGSGPCSAWSRTAVVDVGRQRQDFDGDGYADLVVVARSRQGSSVYVYSGGAALAMTPEWIVHGSATPTTIGRVFSKALWAGDVNADGFADLAVVATDESGHDSIQMYLGGAPASATPFQEFPSPAGSDGAVRSIIAGDVNADGYADLFQSYVGASSTINIVSWGPDLTTSANAPVTEAPIVAGCDLDSDGYTDVLLSDGSMLGGEPMDRFRGSHPVQLGLAAGKTLITCAWNVTGTGRANLLLGGDAGQAAPTTVTTAPSADPSCDGPLPAVATDPSTVTPSASGSTVDVGDVDADGYHDVLIGDPAHNRAALFFGGCSPHRALELPGGTEFAGTPATGAAVAAAGDLDGDGFSDFAVSNVFGGIDDACTGEVYVYRGGPVSGFAAAPAVVLTDPDHAVTLGGCAEDGFGVSID